MGQKRINIIYVNIYRQRTHVGAYSQVEEAKAVTREQLVNKGDKGLLGTVPELVL